MKINLVNMTIADYCAASNRNEILIDRTYQRSPDVWPLPARSYLIETILKGFPKPKLALHQVTDLKSRQTRKYVVDGQQRSSVIRAFFNNELRLSQALELSAAAKCTYQELPPDLQEAFLSYLLDFDQFEAAAEEDVREYFRRINSFTAPLNPEEQRHARYQGPMKWFVYSLTERYSEVLVNLGVLPKKSVVRMADAKFLAEIVHALCYGITTTSKRTLDSMYKAYDRGEELPREPEMRAAIEDAVDQILLWPELVGTSLMRMNVAYSLLLAFILVRKRWQTLQYIGPVKGGVTLRAGENLLRLAAALDEPALFDNYESFTSAAAEKTNVKTQRETRVGWFSRALTEESV